MRLLNAINQHSVLDELKIVLNKLSICLMHIRMSEIFAHVHPLTLCYLTVTLLYLIRLRYQLHHNVQVRAGKGSTVSMTNRHNALEARLNVRLLVHLSDGRVDEVLVHLQVAAGQLPWVFDERILLAHDEHLIVFIYHKSADTDLKARWWDVLNNSWWWVHIGF